MASDPVVLRKRIGKWMLIVGILCFAAGIAANNAANQRNDDSLRFGGGFLGGIGFGLLIGGVVEAKIK